MGRLRSTTSRQRFRTRRRKDPGQDPHWQDIQSSASWLHLRPVPIRGTPTTSLRLAREVSVSHDKFSPRTTSLHLAREVRPRLSSGPGRAAKAHSASTTTDARGGTVPHVMQVQQLAAMQAALPDQSLNVGLTGCTTMTLPSSPTLPYASSAQGTQAPSTTRTRLDLGSGIAGYVGTRAG
jgi:hypothetical protein